MADRSAEPGYGPVAVALGPDMAVDTAVISAVAIARKLATAAGSVVSLIAPSPDDVLQDARSGSLGVDEVVAVRAPWLAVYEATAWAAAIAAAVEQLRPAVLLFPHDGVAAEVAPRVAARFAAGLVTDCLHLEFEADTGALVGHRTVFSGKALAELSVAGNGMKVATVRCGAREATIGEARLPVYSTITLDGEPSLRARVVRRVVRPAGGPRLEDAEVVIGVGRGVGTRSAFEELIAGRLAPALGAACGGSRGAVDLGIVGPELQIGLTGRVISPRLYIAVGVSGSPQHMAGCSGAQVIVAINTDPQAPIFRFAHHGVVGDYRRVVPSFAARVDEILNGRQGPGPGTSGRDVLER